MCGFRYKLHRPLRLGYGHERNMEFLPKGSTKWEEKGNMKIDMVESYALTFLPVDY